MISRAIIVIFTCAALFACDREKKADTPGHTINDRVSEVLSDEQESEIEEAEFEPSEEDLAEEAAVEEKMKNLSSETVVLSGDEMQALQRSRERKKTE